MNFADVEQMVISWAKDRNILQSTSSEAQIIKLEEEFKELCAAISNGSVADVRDAIGDMMVVQTLIAKLNSLDMFQCYAAAYIEIKDRKGKMVNGLFVKE